MSHPITFRAVRGKPCPVCGAESKGCSATDDGLHFCRGESRLGWRRLSDEPDPSGFHLYRRPGEPQRNGSARPADRPPRHDWQARAARFAARLTDEVRVRLTDSLRLPAESIRVMPLIGWDPAENCWTFPEWDASGRVVGITRRYRDGTKRMMAGGGRGLTLPADWRNHAGPLLLVEGASDVLASAAVGLVVVGRPSNTGGADYLGELLAHLPTHREVIVVGENDRKPDGQWPGRLGANQTAATLAAKLNRPIKVAFPPGGEKDVRAWVLEQVAGAAEVEDWAGWGRELTEHLTATGTAVDPPPPPRPRFNFIPSDKFAGGDYRPDWLIPGVLVRGQPGVIAGPSKGMKTSVMIDMAVSMAAAKPFLGKFEVSRPVRVAVVSGESGEHTLQETARRVCKARGVSLPSLGANLQWCFDLPSFPDAAGMTEFAARLLELEAEIVFIDPTYLCLGGVDAKNLFEMGTAFRVVSEVLLKAGVTPILIHHANRLLKVGEVMELQHLAYSGLEQFCRQFLLINRAEQYQSDGEHSLWVRVGGSAGHGGLWSVHVSEGVTDDKFEGRTWEVTVATADEARTRKAGERAEEKKATKRKEMQDEETKVLNAIDAEVEKGHEAATKTSISTHSLIDIRKLPAILDRLTEGGMIEEIEFHKTSGRNRKARTKCNGWRRPARADDEPELMSGVEAAEARPHRQAEQPHAAAAEGEDANGSGGS